jgi:hypothetical protein
VKHISPAGGELSGHGVGGLLPVGIHHAMSQ